MYQSNPLCVLKSHYNKLCNKGYYALLKKIWRSNSRFVGTANHELPFYGKKKKKKENAYYPFRWRKRWQTCTTTFFFQNSILCAIKENASSFFVLSFNHRVLCKFQEVTVSEVEYLSQEQGKKAKPSNPDPKVLITFLHISGFA